MSTKASNQPEGATLYECGIHCGPHPSFGVEAEEDARAQLIKVVRVRWYYFPPGAICSTETKKMTSPDNLKQPTATLPLTCKLQIAHLGNMYSRGTKEGIPRVGS